MRISKPIHWHWAWDSVSYQIKPWSYFRRRAGGWTREEAGKSPAIFSRTWTGSLSKPTNRRIAGEPRDGNRAKLSCSFFCVKLLSRIRGMKGTRHVLGCRKIAYIRSGSCWSLKTLVSNVLFLPTGPFTFKRISSRLVGRWNKISPKKARHRGGPSLIQTFLSLNDANPGTFCLNIKKKTWKNKRWEFLKKQFGHSAWRLDALFRLCSSDTWD